MIPPRILVVDDQFARNATERYVFLQSVNLDKQGSSGEPPPYAEAVFCSGQREVDNQLINDYAVVRDAVSSGDWALVLLDVQFDSGIWDANGRTRGQPGDDLFGMEIRRMLKMEFPALPVVMMTGKRQEEIGDDDIPYLSKHGLGAYELRRALLRFGHIDAISSCALLGLGEDILADDPVTLATFRGAFVHAGSNASVLILGESGTGKEVLAGYLHRMSSRSSGPFVPVNVAAMPKDLVESELFGIGRRIATGVDARAGKFEAASSGTLFLDEIGDMPIETQAKVLRALETREIVRVGEAEAIPVDIRLVSATSRDLAQRLTSGDFGLDLLHRINTVTVTMPPLRERRLDIAPLARRFLDKFAASQGKNGLSFSADALAILGNQPFPGNVRELKNLVERLASAAGHQQMIGRHEVLEALGPKLETTQAAQPPGESQTGSVLSQVPATHIPLETPKLGELADWLDQVRVDKNDPALRGIKPRLDAALQRLGQRLAGAALERCRDPNGHSLNRQSAMRYLMGDTTLNGKNPARLVNEILGRAQAQKVTEEDLEQLIALWSDGESHELP